MKRIAYLLLLLLPTAAFANDGAYYASGNHLIPMVETDISVRKEVLTMTRKGEWIEVNVYYEFYNPTAAKELIVGFEAASGRADVDDYRRLYPNHPYIKDFTVELNGKKQVYGISYVDKLAWNNDTMALPYYRKGTMMTIDWEKGMKEFEKAAVDEWGDAPPFEFVYHFKARFEPGVNVVRHTYRYASNDIAGLDYQIDYILTAANRWANRQIDDFTLRLDMGERQSFWVEPLFYTSPDEWTIEGRGRKGSWVSWWGAIEAKSSMFHMQQGSVLFRKSNFHPKGELIIESLFFDIDFYLTDSDSNDEIFEALRERYADMYKNFEYAVKETKMDYRQNLRLSADELRILRNLPFAQRGNRFKNAALQAYYESTAWYLPNDKYKPEMSTLTKEEQFWVNYWKE